jgi:hypothetical protein
MVIGSVLLQPRKIDPARRWDSALLDDILTFGVRLTWDQTHGGSAFALIAAAMQTVLEGMLDHTKAGRDSALRKFQALLQPVADSLVSLANDLPGEADPHEIFVGGEKMFALLAQAANSLTVAQLHTLLDQALQIVTEDLGLTDNYVQAQVAAVFDEIIRRLRTAPAEADRSLRENRLEMAALLRRIERALRGLFVLPPLNADRLAGPLFDLLRKIDFDDGARRAAAAGKALQNGLTAGAALSDLVPFSMSFGAGGMGAAESGSAAAKKKLWYASWITSDDVRGDDPANDPSLRQYTFDTITPASLEKTAFISNIVALGLAALFNLLTGLSYGQFAKTGLQAATGVLGIVLQAVLDFDMNDLPWYVKGVGPFAGIGPLGGQGPIGAIPIGTAVLANFEGRWFDGALYFFRFLYNLVQLGGGASFTQFMNIVQYDRFRDAVLSVMTHLNYQSTLAEPLPGDLDRRPLNREKIKGTTVFTMMMGGGLVHAALLPHNFFSVGFGETNTFGESRHPFGTFFSALVWGALGISIVSFFTFGTIAACIPPVEPDAGDAALAWLEGFGNSMLSAFQFWYLFTDGNTDNGKTGYLPDESRGNKVAFPGYPDRGSTPYLLPYERGIGQQQCVQGNHGIWSHNSTRNIPLDFAYDFSMSSGTEVLSMRAGTIFTATDTPASDEGVKVVIRHLTTDANRAKFDFDQTGHTVVTYATYLHGVAGSVAAAFGGSVPAPGTAVPQGRVIMKCGSTGDAAFSLVHVDIRPEISNAPGNYTIPFTFRDEGVKSDDGVPKSLNYYTSDNQRV